MNFDPDDHFKAMAEQGIGGAVSLNFDSSEDKALAVRFLREPQFNEAKSKAAGRAVFDTLEICEIRPPGSRDVIRTVVSEKEKHRFPRHYAAFMADADQDAAVGTPLSQWPIITTSPGMIEEAKYLGIRTVEALAQAPDTAVQRLGTGWLDMRKKAVSWLKSAKDGAVLNRMSEELTERDRRISALEQMVMKQAQEIEAARNGGTLPAVQAGPDPRLAALEAKLEALVAAKAEPPKKRGRPPKIVAPE